MTSPLSSAAILTRTADTIRHRGLAGAARLGLRLAKNSLGGSRLPLNPDLPSFGTFSAGIPEIPGLQDFLGTPNILLRPSAAEAPLLQGILNWGRKRSGLAGEAFAARHGVPCLYLEDGFLRSAGPLDQTCAPLSIVVDPEGVYYDARHPSQLETLLRTTDIGGNAALMDRARSSIERLQTLRLSKYNAAPHATARRGREILVLGQATGDLSLEMGLASEWSPARLCRLAAEENPGRLITYRLHPDVAAGLRPAPPGLDELRRYATVVQPDEPLHAALARADHCYTATSLSGLEALLAGIPTTVVGAPFWAGWGAAHEHLSPQISRRGVPRTAEEIFAAAYILYPRYRNPWTGERIEIEEAIEVLGTLARHRGKQSRSVLVNVTHWKRKRVAAMVSPPAISSPAIPPVQIGTLPSGIRAVGWASRMNPHDVARWRCLGKHISFLEDGFLRSTGLGAALTLPISLVLDNQRPHYDPSGPSDIEQLLATHVFQPQDEAAAQELMAFMRAARLGKYGVGAPLTGSHHQPDYHLILGQVEDDASIRLGTRSITTNSDLIHSTRQLYPEAHLLYLPHPDVVAGLRSGHVSPETLAKNNVELAAGPLASHLPDAQRVHVMTSTGGLEALIAGRPVTCHGWPFYAGWGLTQDVDPAIPEGLAQRRSRNITLSQLIAAAYILYPLYLDPVSGLPCDAITAARRIAAGQAAERAGGPLRALLRLSRQILPPGVFGPGGRKAPAQATEAAR